MKQVCKRCPLAWLIGLMLCGLMLCGCERQTGPATVPVSGRVVQGGEGVAEAVVVFAPKTSDEQSVLSSQAVTEDDGSFVLQTFLGEDNYKDGIQPGDYLVTVTKLEVVQDMRTKPKHLLPKKYSVARSSGLAAKVSAGADNHFEFDVQ